METMELYLDRKWGEARKKYLEILNMFPDDALAKEGLQSIRVDEMNEEVDRLYSNGRVSEARNKCLEVLQIDPDNEKAQKCASPAPYEESPPTPNR